MNDYEEDLNRTTAKWIGLIILVALLFLTLLMLITSGCVTAAKNTYANAVSTPTPVPTEVIPEVTAEPEITIPEVIVTESIESFKARTNGYSLKEWHQWFKTNVQGINGQGTKDLRTLVTIYDYKFMDSYHWWSVSWARKFVVKPDDSKDQFLFAFVNMYSDDIFADDVRQYGMGCDHFSAQVDDRLYFADNFEYPERRITEFDNSYTYDHIETPGPYGYKIVQEAGSGIISAQSKEWLMGGRSNAWDGYCQYQIPRYDRDGNPVNKTNVKIVGNFANLGGNAWWQLE
jgi:hypothetical protein